MGDKSRIEWCDATWNPITGCTPISAGCDHCYAKRMAERFWRQIHGRITTPDRPFERVNFHGDRLDVPLRWKKPRRIFVCSMGDLFHEDVTDDQILSVWTAMGEFYDAKGQMQPFEKRPGHTYMVLTKRPDRMRDFLKSRYPEHFQRTNVWLGVTAENQEMADERIPILLQTTAAKRFVSVEPMLGPMDLRPYLPHEFNREPHCPWCEDCIPRGDHGSDWWKDVREDKHGPFLDWVICGGESGPGARPMHPDWPRSLRDQCQAAGVPFFFKQWGSHSPMGAALKGNPYHEAGWNVKAKKHGCLLDGREWKEFPA